jgi:hypothetical protein
MTEIITFSIPRELREKVDKLRGDIARSKFITRVLEEHLIKERTSSYPQAGLSSLGLDQPVKGKIVSNEYRMREAGDSIGK